MRTIIKAASLGALAAAAIACAQQSDHQTVSGKVAINNFDSTILGVRAVQGVDVVATASVDPETGSFAIDIPTGDRYRLEVVTANGAHTFSARGARGAKTIFFDVCDPGAPYDVGHVHGWDEDGTPGDPGEPNDPWDPTDPGEPHDCDDFPCDDPSDPNCEPPPWPCDDPSDPNCEPTPCDDPSDPNCEPTPCDDPSDPNCEPTPCDDPGDPNCCGPDGNCEPPPPPCDDPNDPACCPAPGPDGTCGEPPPCNDPTDPNCCPDGQCEPPPPPCDDPNDPACCDPDGQCEPPSPCDDPNDPACCGPDGQCEPPWPCDDPGPDGSCWPDPEEPICDPGQPVDPSGPNDPGLPPEPTECWDDDGAVCEYALPSFGCEAGD